VDKASRDRYVGGNAAGLWITAAAATMRRPRWVAQDARAV